MAEETQVKKPMRGVGNAQGTQRLKFSHEHALKNGLFIAALEDVKVNTIEIGADKTGMPSFAGLAIPRISFTFRSIDPKETAHKYVNLSFTAVESNADTIPSGKNAWQVNTVFDYFKHILDVYYLRGRELTDEESALLALSYDDTNELGEYQPVEPETVVAAWTTLFENFANLLNAGKDGKCAYKTADGKLIPAWIKLIRYFKNKSGWKAVSNGNLGFPNFVGEGCIEIFKQDVAPSIRINVINERITPMQEADTAKAPSALPGDNNYNITGNTEIPTNSPFDDGESPF